MGVGPRLGGSSHVCYDNGPTVEKDMQKKIDAVRAELEAARQANPDPSRWELLDDYLVGPYIVLRVQYPNCTNHKGVKVLVYKANLSQLVKQKTLDPHFGDKEGYLYPIARFAPTDEGYANAVSFVRMKVPNGGQWIPGEYDRNGDK